MKAYLGQYRALSLRYEELTQQIRLLEERATDTAAKIRAVNVRGGGAYDGNAEIIADIADARTALGETLRDCDHRMAEIIRAIEGVPLEMEKLVLTKRYISGKSWEAISQEIGYCKSSIYRLHGWGLADIRRELEARQVWAEG